MKNKIFSASPAVNPPGTAPYHPPLTNTLNPPCPTLRYRRALLTRLRQHSYLQGRIDGRRPYRDAMFKKLENRKIQLEKEIRDAELALYIHDFDYANDFPNSFRLAPFAPNELCQYLAHGMNEKDNTLLHNHALRQEDFIIQNGYHPRNYHFPLENYDPNQPRDDWGRWTDEGKGESATTNASEYYPPNVAGPVPKWMIKTQPTFKPLPSMPSSPSYDVNTVAPPVGAKAQYAPATELNQPTRKSEQEKQRFENEDKPTPPAKTSYEGLKSYKGDFPSPLPVMFYVPSNSKELLKIYYPPKEIRSWVEDAAKYHGVPQEILATVIQQENGPRATTFQKTGQFAERTLTTAAAIADEIVGVVPDAISGGSSGFVNMSRATLKDAAKYIEENYKKGPLPSSVKYRLWGWNQDTRISGDDYKADLYYASAHLRQLIDRVTREKGFSENLTRTQIEKVFAAYNGSGPKAEKYGRDAIDLLEKANKNEATLYFYQQTAP